MSERKKPAIHTATAFIAGHLSKGTWATMPSLPSISALAKSASVSLNTMVTVLKQFQKNGRLKIRHGAGIFINTRDSQKVTAEPLLKDKKWQKLEKQLHRDIFSNGLPCPDGRLPSLKEMIRHYGVHPLTLKKALAFLEHDNVISPADKSYRILSTRTHLSNLPLLLFTEKDFYLNLRVEYYEATAGVFLSRLEEECLRRKIPLLVKNYPLTPSEAGITAGACFGAIVWVRPGREDETLDLLRNLARSPNPVFVIDVQGDFKLPQACKNNRRIHHFRVNETQAGRLLSRHIIEMGHKKAAFFASDIADWSRLRFEGASQAWHEAGRTPGDLLFISVPLEASQNPDNDLTAILDNRHRYLKLTAERIRKDLPDSSHAREIAFMLEWAALYVSRSEMALSNAVQKALSVPDITAWMTDSEETAIHGLLPHLAKNNKTVPGDISVACIGNTTRTISSRLTALDFNFQGLVPKIMNLLLSPRQFGGAGRQNRPMDIEHMVVPRTSVKLVSG